jgi:hypothetical protein
LLLRQRRRIVFAEMRRTPGRSFSLGFLPLAVRKYPSIKRRPRQSAAIAKADAKVGLTLTALQNSVSAPSIVYLFRGCRFKPRK